MFFLLAQICKTFGDIVDNNGQISQERVLSEHTFELWMSNTKRTILRG